MEHKAIEIEVDKQIFYFNFSDFEERQSFHRELMKMCKV